MYRITLLLLIASACFAQFSEVRLDSFTIQNAEEYADRWAHWHSFEQDKENIVYIPIGWTYTKSSRKYWDADSWPPVQSFTVTSTPNTDRINFHSPVKWRIRRYNIKDAGSPVLVNDNWVGSGVNVHPKHARRDSVKLRAKIRNKLKLKPSS